MILTLSRELGAVVALVRDPLLLAAGTVLLLLFAYCWTVKNPDRTTNAVNLISAFRALREPGEPRRGPRPRLPKAEAVGAGRRRPRSGGRGRGG
ncbi:hypothetical protein AB0M35_20755 [Micromonospora sp. NPDC051196]|uniref:hypothetical protein n=1 Tax=Micromonospora sp. NPDC051196 TaxID=3155281 RepID=UPI00341C6884